MKQLRFTTTTPHSMFGGENAKPVIDIMGLEDREEVIEDKIRGTGAYIHADAESLARFDIPVFIDGNLGQLDLPIEEQDILMLLPDGEHQCKAELQDSNGGIMTSPNKYYLTLKAQPKEGWSDSIIGNARVHYYKDGVSLCGRSKVNNGHKHFDKSLRSEDDSYSYHCKICIKKQNEQRRD